MDLIIAIATVIALTLVSAAILAWAVYAPGSRKAFERDKQKFAEGRGRDPMKRVLGPHLPYANNLRMFALITLPLWLVFVVYAARRL
ncbi:MULTISPECIES: hypothetical protein [unclassified Bosea (in: a-proteobacteria)]|uniref:hypothetical protein n=1 Tax=unclassified Bosea (in: a-proteobacteria) TaxID=2653178 RepID=UPI000F750EB0|nr:MULTISPECIES: hypothetical protein [unclassified Bosea (in: a-proteobacteria)]AZO76880.1 hypothetical protein BLM15_04080 [Bosea sp. Tri-49]RXT21715.1 hypothetical protein B5U98_14700 [Bosea sp. Tri-39]RXT32054.1 hypothetical protein B5U99_25545 [Bosea sp. Tri-54]